MARAKWRYGVLVVNADGFRLASVGDELEGLAGCRAWIKEHGEPAPQRYQPIAFLGDPLTVEVTNVEKRKLASSEPAKKGLDSGESEPVE